MAIWQKVNCLPYIRRATSESLKDGSYILTVDKSTHTGHTPVLLLLLQQYSFGYYTCNPAGVLWYSDLSTGVLLPGTAAILFFFEEDKRQCHKDTDMGPLIANLLLSVLQSTLQRRWNFSGLATIVRIVLMYYLNLENFFNNPEADLKRMLVEATNPPPEREEID